MKRTFLATALFAAIHAVQAADYCVATEAGLRAALEAAQESAEDDRIRIGRVTIGLAAPLTFAPSGGSAGALELSGGWSPDCSAQSPGAIWTRLEPTAPQVSVDLAPDGDLTVSDLHFLNLQGVHLSNAVDGSQFITLTVSRVGVFNDFLAASDALSLYSPADLIAVDNLLVDAVSFCAVAAATFKTGGEVTLRSSTLIARKSPDFAGAGSAMCFDGIEAAASNAAIDSVFHSTHNVDIQVNGRPVILRGSAYSDFCEPCAVVNPLDPQSTANLVLPLSFDTQASGELARFHRASQSTAMFAGLIDSGVSQDTAQFPYDILGQPRLAGGGIDRGAFEFPLDTSLFRNGFEGS